PPRLQLAPLRIAVAQQRRHGRRDAQRAVPYDRPSLDLLAGAVDVALAIEEGRVALARRRGAADVEPRGIDRHLIEQEEAEVVPLLDRHHVGRALRDRFRVAYP